jgi:glycosyltransferase involved in cell wall biosynthesis
MSELKPLKLEVVIATYNRAHLLRRTLQSLAQARRADSLSVVVTVADNNSTDDTRQVAEEFVPLFGDIKLDYIFEKRQGKQFALNTALGKSDADLIAMIDDDEEVAEDWFVELAHLFGSRWEELDFASGKMLPRWESEPAPAWASPSWAGIGWREFGDEEWTHTADTPIACGGHAIYKLSLFHELGFYHEAVGPQGKNLMGCEDDVIYDKLISAGKRGVYCPKLIVWHFVPDYRLTRNYLRQWSYGNGASQNLVDIYYKPFDGKRFLRVPRYLYRQAAASLRKSLLARLRGKSEDAFAAEREFWVFWGFFYSRNIQNSRFESAFKFLNAKVLQPVNR